MSPFVNSTNIYQAPTTGSDVKQCISMGNEAEHKADPMLISVELTVRMGGYCYKRESSGCGGYLKARSEFLSLP